jgi:hypothetical protein
MSRPNVYIFDCETQEGITREMNDEEYAQHLIDVANGEEIVAAQAQAHAAAEAKAEAKRQALAALGLSQEIINLLAE